MNKTKIKNYAIWARNKFIADITYKAALLGVTEKEIKNPLPQSTQTVQFFDIGTKEPSSIIGPAIEQRKKLVEEIQQKTKQSDYSTAYKSVMEEVAYTWFNRLIAIRFMEINKYLPTGIRVLSSESAGKAEPDLVTFALETLLDYSAYEKDRIVQLKHENKLDELFRMLFIKQCNALNANLPELFEKTNDYTELLLNVSFTDKEGVIYHLVNDINEDDFDVSKEGQVEIIGWLYQYYNEERKNEVINIYKGTIKKDDIPAATQLFTTDWVVRYMVDNSLGRYWIERNPNSKLPEKLQYFVQSKTSEIKAVDEKITPEELTIFDPCMGSGHILVYAFDILMEIYKERGYTEKDAVPLIVKNNLFGLDIDNRAYQLAYFAIMMKAQSYDRKFLASEIEPNIATIIETNEFSRFTCNEITKDATQNKIGEYLIGVYKHAKEIGSLLSIQHNDYEAFALYLEGCSSEGQLSIESDYWFRVLKPSMIKVAKQAKIMANKYTVISTNPPYLNKLEGQLRKFVAEEYKQYSGDLFSVFMYRNFGYCKPKGFSAFMTPFVWMFIKTYEQLREFIISQKSITTLIQMEYSAYEEATVPICSFVLKNGQEKESGFYLKLSEFKGGMEVQKNKVVEALNDKDCNYFYETSKEIFSRIPGSPIAYWASSEVIGAFAKGTPMISLIEPRQGLATTDNNQFIRLWHEVSITNISFNTKSTIQTEKSSIKWVPYNKGGARRQWYGNYDYVVDWSNNGDAIKKNVLRKYTYLKTPDFVVKNTAYYFREAITWSLITSGGFSIRYREGGSIHDVSGMSAFSDNHETLLYILGLLSTKISNYLFKMLNPTINLQIGDFNNFPVLLKQDNEIIQIVNQCIELSKAEWDSYETSWDFLTHPLIKYSNDEQTIEKIFLRWETHSNEVFNDIKKNEEELNKRFIDLYGLQKELNYYLSNDDITICVAELGKDIRSFISYAVGCMFGRYSLDVDGLAYAGGAWDETKYNTFIPDKDNILPLSDEEYYEDDIVNLFVAFIKKVFGAHALEENLDFIANALDNSGNSSREILRNYFLNGFYKDHCKTYKRRPIYWLFESGKQNGFKALIYMHQYNENTIGHLRIEYLHKMQRIYENEISRMQETIENSQDAREVTAATKRKDKLIKQLQETKEYDEKIAHLALARISIDLDDGVKVNYEKVQTDKDGKKLDVLAKI